MHTYRGLFDLYQLHFKKAFLQGDKQKIEVAAAAARSPAPTFKFGVRGNGQKLKERME